MSGTVVVGWLRTAAGDLHAFAYDLAAGDRVMQDLGTLGGSDGEAVAVDGTIVVGWAETSSGGRRAFAYDLTSAEPAMRDFSTLGSAKSWASGIAGDFVIGGWRRGWPLRHVRKHAFAHDLTAADPRSLVLGGWQGSVAEDIDGNVVIGSRAYGSSSTPYATAGCCARRPGRALASGGSSVR